MKAAGDKPKKISQNDLLRIQRRWAGDLARDYPCVFWRLFVISEKYINGSYYDEDLAKLAGESATDVIILLTHEEAFGQWRALSPEQQAQDLQAYLIQTVGFPLCMKDVLAFALRLVPPTAPPSEVQFFLAEVYLLFRQVPGVR